MTAPYKHNQRVIHIPTGSVGQVRHYYGHGFWRVWFNEADWRGDKGLFRHGRVSMFVHENDMKEEAGK